MPSALKDFGSARAGASIVVCGCGPSLHELEQPQRFVTIGVNDVGRLFDPTYLVVVNPRQQFEGERFRYVEQSGAQALFTQLDLGTVRPPVVRFKLGQYGGTDNSAGDVLHYTQNSPYVAVCLAAYMGATRIGLVGVDLTEDHFFARTGTHPLSARLREIDAQYARLAAALRQRGVALFNLSARSRLQALPYAELDSMVAAPSALEAAAAGAQRNANTSANPWAKGLRIVSYATTPVAGVPAVLGRCIAAATGHTARCVWASSGYGNGVEFAGDVQWASQPQEATALLQAADLVIVHNGKVDPSHQRLLDTKPVLTMAHNYGWNVDMQFVRRGLPGVVVGQYQATLPEFARWAVVPNPMPLWETDYAEADKGSRIGIAYTPSGRHERYPRDHRLYWHGKGYASTLRVLERLARRADVHVETTAQGPVSHARALAMKRGAHIVIDECVTGSYHRNSLEGLAASCVVVNGVGLLLGVEQVLRRCAPGAADLPFVCSSLDALESCLLRLIDQGPEALAAQGRSNRAWVQQHWDFAQQWQTFWQPVCEEALRVMQASPVGAHGARVERAVPQPAGALPERAPVPEAAAASAPVAVQPLAGRPAPMPARHDADAVSVIVPHGGTERLPQLAATVAHLRQAEGVGEIIVVELGSEPVALDLALRWADKHLFVAHHGAFERALALNAGQAKAECALLLWHDNDLLAAPGFVPRAVQELRARKLDYLIPFSAIAYLTQADTQAVLRGTRGPEACTPEQALGVGALSGGMGLVRRDFVARHGGLVQGFKGWGGEDNAWNHKVGLLGRSARTQRQDQQVYHLYHPGSNGSQQGVAARSNPHYADNVALMNQVFAVRSAAEFAQRFAPQPAAQGTLTRREPPPFDPAALTVWVYWEGPRPQWIEACWRTLAAAAPQVRLLDAQSFDRLWDRDRDIQLARLQVAHRADFIRAFLLARFGGMWIDADCLVMQPLLPVLEHLRTHAFVAHRERVGLVSNAFIAARPGSAIAAEFYRRVCAVLRTRRPLGWNGIGAVPLTAVLEENRGDWYELPCERVQPICWSTPELFFAQRSAAEHASAFDDKALCYMLSNGAVKTYSAKHPGADLQAPASFFGASLNPL